MIQIFSTENNQVNELTQELSLGLELNNKWINLVNPTDREIELTAKVSGATEEMLKSALDEEERARIEEEDGITLTLFDIPTIEDEDDYFSYSTMPLGVIVTSKCIITICLKESSIINNFINNRVKTFCINKRSRFLYQLLYTSHIKYLQYLRQIDKASQRIQNELHRSTKNKELIQLLDLEKSLVYFSTSLRSNCLVIEKLGKFEFIKKFEDDMALLEDVAIENRQAIEMCNIYRDILSGTMDAFASVISNNLNIVMKVLTTLTVILSIPQLISSFFGMNTGVPFEGSIGGFYIVMAISAVVTTLAAYIILKKNKVK